MPSLWFNGEGPDGIPLILNVHLVTKRNFDPDYLAGLECVQRVDFLADDAVVFFRLFDPVDVPGNITITDYGALDEHPELIHYEGHIDPKNHWINVVPGRSRAPRQSEEIKPPPQRHFPANLFHRG